jgi:hypothetical protein
MVGFGLLVGKGMVEFGVVVGKVAVGDAKDMVGKVPLYSIVQRGFKESIGNFRIAHLAPHVDITLETHGFMDAPISFLASFYGIEFLQKLSLWFFHGDLARGFEWFLVLIVGYEGGCNREAYLAIVQLFRGGRDTIEGLTQFFGSAFVVVVYAGVAPRYDSGSNHIMVKFTLGSNTRKRQRCKQKFR